MGLEKVQNATDASTANFPQRNLSKLEVVWSDVWDGSRNKMLEKDVLNELKPRNDKLIKLKIRSYGGLEFRKWVGNPLFVHLKHVSLSGCKRCTSLPSLSQLQSLKELIIQDLEGVKYVEDCPKLVEVTLEKLNSLNVLKLKNCDHGVLRRLVEVTSSVTKLEIENILGLNDVVWRGVICRLRALEELSIDECNAIRYVWESEAVESKVLVNLRVLEVDRCGNLVSLGEEEYDEDSKLHIASLRMLKNIWLS
ncbi:hypothetical protein R6Q57_008627 [Mikania cordata]